MEEYGPRQEMDFQREMLDKQQAGDPNTVYADTMREEKIKNVIAQLNPELLLTEIEHRIRGEKRNPKTDEWEPISKDGDQISEELVQNYISFLNVYLTQNNSLSNFSPEEINNIMEVVIDYVKDDLSDNAEKYNLTKKTYLEVPQTIKILTPVHVKEEVPFQEKKKISFISKSLNALLRRPHPTVTRTRTIEYTYMKETTSQVKVKVAVGEELTDYNQFTKIGHIVCQSTFSVLKQAQNGMLASRIFKALRVNESINGGQKSKLEAFKFW